MRHAMKGKPTHEHDTVEEARACWELNTSTTVPQGTVDDHGLLRPVKHEEPCVCGPYDRCREVRTADAQWSGNWRDQFRAYND